MPETTDPADALETLGYKGTSSAGAKSVVTSTAGEEGFLTSESQFWGEGHGETDPPHSSGTTASLHHYEEELEARTVRFHSVLWGVELAQQEMGVENPEAFFRSIVDMAERVNKLESKLAEVEGGTSEDSNSGGSNHGTPIDQGTTEREETKMFMETKFIALSQVVFVVLSGIAVAISFSMESQLLGLLATFSVPIFLLLAFAGVITERMIAQPNA